MGASVLIKQVLEYLSVLMCYIQDNRLGPQIVLLSMGSRQGRKHWGAQEAGRGWIKKSMTGNLSVQPAQSHHKTAPSGEVGGNHDINGSMDKQTVVHPHNKILFSDKRNELPKAIKRYGRNLTCILLK